jgi:hypothetical protein
MADIKYCVCSSTWKFQTGSWDKEYPMVNILAKRMVLETRLQQACQEFVVDLGN